MSEHVRLTVLALTDSQLHLLNQVLDNAEADAFAVDREFGSGGDWLADREAAIAGVRSIAAGVLAVTLDIDGTLP